MQFVSLPEQFTPNRPSKHWHCPSIPQVPWPLHVVLGLQNAKTNEKKVSNVRSVKMIPSAVVIHYCAWYLFLRNRR